MCMGHNEIKPPIYEKSLEKIPCICMNCRLENGLMYLCFAFHFDVINASTASTKYKA